MKVEHFPYLRDISIDYKHHIGGYMGGGSWAITTKRDSNGDRARIILGRGLSFRSHGDNVTFKIIEPNLEILQLQWTFFRGVKPFPDEWRRNRYFGYNSVIYAHFQQIHIEVAKDELQKLQEAKEGETVIQIKYSDTDAMFDRQVKKALREFGIPEDVIQEQNFKYG